MNDEEGARPDAGENRKTADKNIVAGSRPRDPKTPAVVANAAGGTVSFGIPGAAREGRRFCNLVSDSGAGGRGHGAAGTPVRDGCGDLVLRYSVGAESFGATALV